MRIRHPLSRRLLLVFALGLLSALPLSAQVSRIPPRITQAVNESRLAALRGNTHPMARAEFDRGAAPADLPMERMMLLLKRSPEQEAALEKFMAEQLDPSSPNFHHWLSPEQFGEQFGPSDQDIQAIAAWLASHGFAVNQVSKGRTTIEFSGTHALVQEAFHAAIHKFVLPNGEEHWANASDPAIPAALAPVVAGVHSLHDFFPKPMNHIRGLFSSLAPTAGAKPRPMFTFEATGPCSLLQDSPFFLLPPGIGIGSGECFMVTPADLAVIYNIASLWNANPAIDGTGQTIAIVGGSNINVQDVRNFRSLMGLPAKDPVIILAGANPGINNSFDYETEALIDVEWSGAVAKNATLDLVIARDSLTMAGVDIAAQFIVDNNLAPVLSMSFGLCELGLGTSGNNFYNTLWQRAAAQGITVLVSSGDDGSAGCDFGSGAATGGLAVNGLASTPFNVAVGGTDFNDVTPPINPTNFWNTGGADPKQASAMGYIPETVWNDTCTNPIFRPPTFSNFGATAEEACNHFMITPLGLDEPLGGSGGVSNCTTPSGSSPSNCSGGYAKPAWQTGTGVPNDGKRDLPDVSLFAGLGKISASLYYFCESDLTTPPSACSFQQGAQIFGVGGTSVSAQVFAGVMALVNQKAGERQGNANSVLYTLAAQAGATCPSAANPLPTCMFYDVTAGTIAMPCKAGTSPSPNCYAALGTDPIGVLSSAVPPSSAQAYEAGTGYDLATGLGTINAANLVNATQPGNSSGWATNSSNPDFTLTSSGVVTVSGNTGTLSITVNPQGGFGGTLTLSCKALPAGETCSFMPSSQPLVNGTTPITVTIKGAAAFVRPTSRPRDWRAPGGGIALLGAFLTAILLLSLRGRPRRWSAALAVVALAVIVGAVGCGGSGSSGGGGGSTLIAGTGVVVATGSGVTHSIGFTIP